MGNQRQFIRGKGFSISLYETDEKYASVTINGITAKVVRKKGDNNGQGGLPTYTNTSNMYFKEGHNGDIIQGAYYGKDRKIRISFDWAHEHYNDPKKGGNGKRFEKGVVHIHPYTTDENGKVVRKGINARLMTDNEIKKFGAIIKFFNPNVKFKNDKKKK
ncbi:MAG: hypothetical protein LUC37_03755 [Prevotella sp.]|nr:hypothetical protein [Prevotella sp.]